MIHAPQFKIRPMSEKLDANFFFLIYLESTKNPSDTFLAVIFVQNNVLMRGQFLTRMSQSTFILDNKEKRLRNRVSMIQIKVTLNFLRGLSIIVAYLHLLCCKSIYSGGNILQVKTKSEQRPMSKKLYNSPLHCVVPCSRC